MKLGHIEIFATDVEKSLEFYRDILGFEVVAIQGENFAWLKAGEMEFLIRPRQNTLPESGERYQHTPIGLCLYTDDLKGKMEALKSNGLEFRGDDGSPDCPTFRDPDGNWFQLVDPGEHQ